MADWYVALSDTDDLETELALLGRLTQMWDSSCTIVITVGGADVSAYLVANSLRVSQSLGAELDSCEFELEDYDDGLGTFTTWSEVRITYVDTDGDSHTLFGGYAVSLKARGAPGEKTTVWSISCLDYGVLTQKVIANTPYSGVTGGYILNALFISLLPEIDATTYVDAGGTHDVLFDRRTLFDCIKQVADEDGYLWWIDYDKHLHYIPSTRSISAPFNIADATSADFAESFPYMAGSLNADEDGSDIRNSVSVYGGYQTSTPQTNEWTGDGVTTDFNFPAEFTPINAVGVVSIDGVAQVVGRDFIDNPANYDTMVNWSLGVLKFAVAPTAGTNIVALYTYDVAIVETVSEAASILQYGRTFKYAHVDPSITSSGAAQMVAEAILAQYAYAQVYGSLTIERLGLEPGQALTITATALGWTNEPFMIQSASHELKAGGILSTTIRFGSREPTLLDTMRGIAGSSGGVASGGTGSGRGTVLGNRIDTRQPTAYQYITDTGGAQYLVPVYDVSLGSQAIDFSSEDNSMYVLLM